MNSTRPANRRRSSRSSISFKPSFLTNQLSTKPGALPHRNGPCDDPPVLANENALGVLESARGPPPSRRNRGVPQASSPTFPTDPSTSYFEIEKSKVAGGTGDFVHQSLLLSDLPGDVMLHTLSYLNPMDVDGDSKMTCKALWRASRSIPLWKEFCLRTGKLHPSVVEKKMEGCPIFEHDITQCDQQLGNVNSTEKSTSINRNTCARSLPEENPFRTLYYHNPCVPVDFQSISTALSHCPRGGGSVLLMPGLYREQITIENQSEHDLSIRAAFPEVGAALTFCYHTRPHEDENTTGSNQPCINIHSSIPNNNNTKAQRSIVTLSHLQILHCTRGADIWGGNCAVRVDGLGNHLALESCTLQSDSGRGVVVTNGASLEMHSTVVHDCAATGLYVGDAGTRAAIWGCNVVRNGGGSRRIAPARRERHQVRAASALQETMEMMVDSDSDEESFSDDHENVEGYGMGDEDEERVPPGHSGIYVETGSAIIDNCLLSGNSLTGLSVVRGGAVRLSGCDLTENGADPITVEDAHDINGNGNNNRTIIRGGVLEGPTRNNYLSIVPLLGVNGGDICYHSEQQNAGGAAHEGNVVHGGIIRPTNFPHATRGHTSESQLRRKFTNDCV